MCVSGVLKGLQCGLTESLTHAAHCRLPPPPLSCGAQMYHHFTCATDTGNVCTVFNTCKEIILQGNLKGSGFMN